MANFKLTIEYEGTNYCGWQRQPEQLSIQEIIETAIKRIAKKNIKLTGAGRTDSGVHAFNYIANFSVITTISFNQWKMALNSILPADIVIKKVEIVKDNFHSRYCAKSKIYDYIIINRNYPSALYNKYAWFIKHPLNLENIKKTLPLFIGEKDFTSFTVTKSAANRNNICNIHYFRFKKMNDFLIFSIRGDRFLHHMVRNIIGTVVDIGKERVCVNKIGEIITAKNRTLAGITAPAQGLFLKRIYY